MYVNTNTSSLTLNDFASKNTTLNITLWIMFISSHQLTISISLSNFYRHCDITSDQFYKMCFNFEIVNWYTQRRAQELIFCRALFIDEISLFAITYPTRKGMQNYFLYKHCTERHASVYHAVVVGNIWHSINKAKIRIEMCKVWLKRLYHNQ